MKHKEKIIENLRDFTAKYQYEDQKLSETCFRAVDAIEELQSQLPKWIPVSEKLPSTDDEVLVYMYDSIYLAWVDRNGNWYTNSFNIEVEDYPKYWMPLPEPPKDGE